MTRSFCLVILLSSLGLLFINNSLPAPVDTGPIWTAFGATHEILTQPKQGNYTLRSRIAAFGHTVDNANITLDISYNENLGCDAADFNTTEWILLMRGKCSFVAKIRNAQAAGAKGVIIGDDGTAYDALVTMFARSAQDVDIPALFVTHQSYTMLRSINATVNAHIQQTEMKTDWPLLDTLVFICFSPLCTLLIVYIVLFFRRRKMHLANILPPAYLSKLELVTYLPKDGINTECVICLEPFIEGAELLELPCHHLYHDECIKKWLIERKKVCPICVRDVRIGIDVREGRLDESAVMTEQTPLLQNVS